MVSDLQLKTLPAQPALTIRTRASVKQLGGVLGSAFRAILEYLGELGEHPAGASFAVYFNSDMQNLDVAIGFPVTKTLPGKGDIQSSEIPAGAYATCLYTGPYSHISEAYSALEQWMKEMGYLGTGIAYEMYLDDASKTEPAHLRTTVMLALKP